MTDHLSTRHGDDVAYDLRGTGPALIFVAGAGPFRAIDPWTTETAELAAQGGITTLVYDRLGRGESRAEGVLDLDRELGALADLIDLVGGQAVLCGHSSGCSISLRAAAAGLPVTGLALWEAPLAGDAAETQAWSDEVERLMDSGDAEGAQRHYMKDMPPEWLASIESSPEWPMIAAGVVSSRADGQSMAWAVRALEQGRLGGLTVPVLTMFGTETFPEMPVAAERIAVAVPNATVKQMPGAGHSWEPAPMAAELVSFVGSSATPS